MYTFNFNSTTGYVEVEPTLASTIMNSYAFYLNEDSKDNYKSVYPLSEELLGDRYTVFKYEEGRLLYPTGMLRDILKFFKGDCQFVKSYPKARLKTSHSMNSLLRPEQKQFVEKAIKNKRGYLIAYTSFGKSYCISEILDHFTDDTNRLVIVPTIDLLYQFQADIADYLQIDKSQIGLIGDNNCEVKPITVCIPNTIASRLKTAERQQMLDHLANVNVLIVDEMHMCCNVTAAQVIHNCVNADYKLATSATPSVQLPWYNESSYGNQLIHFKQIDGIVKDYIEDPKILFVAAPGNYCNATVLTKLKRKYSHYLYNITYNQLIVKNHGRNRMITEIATQLCSLQEGPILILFKRIDHAKLILELLNETDLRVSYLDGKMKTKDRELVLSDLRNYRTEVCVASETLVSTGISITALAGAINAGAGSNDNQIVQKLGRLVRNRNQNKRPIFVDFDDKSYFTKQSEIRAATCRQHYNYIKHIELGNLYEHL